MSLKYCISSPLEAGTSIIDGRSMPSHLNSALEYTSKRLARKNIHLTLVVVRRDYQLPFGGVSPGLSSGSSSPPANFHSPLPVSSTCISAGNSVLPGFSLSGIKSIVRSSTFPLTQGFSSGNGNATQERTGDANVSYSYSDQLRNGMASPACSISSMSSVASTASTASSVASSIGSSQRWPLSPTTPSYSLATPATPATPYSEVSRSTHNTTDASSAISGVEGPSSGRHPFGIRLVHVSPISAKEEKILSQVLQRAGRKFHIGPHWCPPAVAPSECGLNADLIHRSISQNEVIFASDGLTLLTLDHLYTFKAALASYATTSSSSMLEDAVDELRRLVLAQGELKLRKSILQSSFTRLGPVNDSALSDVIRMYRRAYGGITGESGVENDVDVPTSNNDIRSSSPTASWPLPDQPVFMIDPDVNYKPLPPLPVECELSSSETPSESGESSGWDRDEELNSVTFGTASSSSIDKRFAMVDIDFEFGLNFEVEDYYRLASARDLLAEREEAEAAAWAAAGASGEAVDRADGVLVTELAEVAGVMGRKAEILRPKDPGPLPSTVGLPHSLLLGAIFDSELERATPKVAERPRLQLQTAQPLLVKKPTALRMPMLKLQTSFGSAKVDPVAQFNRRATLSGAESTSGLAGMTPVDGCVPIFLASTSQDDKPYQDEEDGDMTAKPISAHPNRAPHRWTQRWNSIISIDGRLSTSSPLEPQSSRLGPMTPNGYDDISPITRAEWGFMFAGETWKNGRTVAVTTC